MQNSNTIKIGFNVISRIVKVQVFSKKDLHYGVYTNA